MNLKTIAAAAGLALALGSGSALAWDLHDTLAPAGNPTPTVSQTVPAGADLRLPGTGSVTSRGAAYEYQCADAKANAAPGSFEIATFCAPGDR